MNSLQHWLLAWNCSNHTWSETAGSRPKDNSNKTKYFDTLSLPFLRIKPALFHIPSSLFHYSRYTPFDLSGGKVLSKGKKKRKSRKRFCSPTSLASYLEPKLRRKAEKRTLKFGLFKHLSWYSDVIRWVVCDLSFIFSSLMSIVLALGFATFRYNVALAKAIPSKLAAVWLQDGLNDCTFQKFLGTRCSFISLIVHGLCRFRFY